MTLIKFSDLHVFEALLAKAPNGLDHLHQVFPRVGTARGGGFFPGWGRHVEAGFSSQRGRGEGQVPVHMDLA